MTISINRKPTHRYIRSIGIELEGAWSPYSIVASHVEHDGSVFRHRRSPQLLYGEIPSPVFYMKGKNSTLAYLYNWMLQHWPNKVNETCGLHVHLGLRSVYCYQQLMRQRYQKILIRGLHKWALKNGIPHLHPLWGRLAGANATCGGSFFPDYQVSSTDKLYTHNTAGHRYTAVNYSYGLHKTVEIRILPMFSEGADYALSAITQIIEITAGYLSNIKHPYRAKLTIGAL